MFASIFRFVYVFALLLYSLLSVSLFAPVVLWLSSFFALSFFGCVVVSFSLSDYTQKERARRVGASSLVLLWLVVLPLFRFVFLFR